MGTLEATKTMTNSMNVVNNVNATLPWLVVFLVLLAVVFCCSSTFTLVENVKRRLKNRKPLNLVISENTTDDIGVIASIEEQSGREPRARINWRDVPTQIPIDFPGTASENARRF